MRAQAAVCLATGLLLLAVPAGVSASTTVGSSLRQRANLYVRCGGSCTEMQTARPGGAGLTIPADGVITRWRLRAATLGSARLRVLRQAADGTFSVVESSAAVTLDRAHSPGQDVLYEFPVRLPVQAGDRIALDRDAKAGAVFHSYGQEPSYSAARFTPALRDDATGVTPAAPVAGRELLLNVDVEKDADQDGFGDETQDNCPSVPNDQTDKPCTTPPPSSTTGPSGPTATPIDTAPAPTRGGQGPPVSGERPIDKTRRPHGRRPAPRRSPTVPGDDQGRHGGKPHRRAPAPATRKESSGHSGAPRPRRAPTSHSRPVVSHPRQGARKAPRTQRKPAASPHGRRRGARRAPSPQRAPAGYRHSARHAARPAPNPAPAPGFRRHGG